jgi:opacity protein-like surface antigen
MKTTLLSGLVLLAASSFAHAGGGPAVYVGGAYGVTDNNTDTSNLLGDCNPPPASHDYCTAETKDKAWEAHVGVQLGKGGLGLGLEAGYANLGTTADLMYTDPVEATQETTAFTVAGLARLPVGKNLSVYGKAGIARWESEMNVVSNYRENEPDNRIDPASVTETGVSGLVGVGAEYKVNHNVTLRAGWDRYMDVGKEKEALILKDNKVGRLDETGKTGLPKTVKTDVDVFSAGLNYNFY